MTITEIAQAFKQHGFEFSEQEVEEKLNKANMQPEEVDAELITVWVEDFQQSQNKPAPRGKGKTAGLAKSESAPPAAPAPQVPPQQPVIDLSPEAKQTIAAGANALQSQVIEYIGQQESNLADVRTMLVQYNQGLGVRLWTGVAEDLKAKGSYGLDITGTMQSSWDSLKANLKAEISRVNAAAGVKDAAA